MNLTEIGIKYGTDKVRHGYTEIYNKILDKYRLDNFNFLEIGVFYGSSIKMWNEYFTNAQIYAADYYRGINGNKHTFDDPTRFIKEVNDNKNLYNRVNIVGSIK